MNQPFSLLTTRSLITALLAIVLSTSVVHAQVTQAPKSAAVSSTSAPTANPQAPKGTAAPIASPKPFLESTKLIITKDAHEHGFTKCAAAVALAEQNLLGNSEYTFRAYYPPKSNVRAEVGLFTVIVDSLKRDRLGNASRANLNFTVTATTDSKPNSPITCSTMYEQTVHHNASCDSVVAQMAPNAKTSANPSLGSVLVAISDTLSLTLIPVGNAQCITIIKESAFNVSITASNTASTAVSATPLLAR